jgi:hypothetical protein
MLELIGIGEFGMNMHDFLSNRSKVSSVELEKYAGKYIAWSPDGTRVLAAADDPLQVVAILKSAGYDPAECVLSSVPADEEVVLGGGIDE